MQSTFEAVRNHLISSVQMTIIECDDYNAASTKTADVAQRLTKKHKAAQPGNFTDGQTVAFVIAFRVLRMLEDRSGTECSLLTGIQYR
jgi:hypothetical protein